MPLYERLTGRKDDGTPADNKIPIQGFAAVMAEFSRGRLTEAQALAKIAEISDGVPLTTTEQVEAQTLVATISGGGAAKLARTKEMDDVLMLAELGASGYRLPNEVKLRLAV